MRRARSRAPSPKSAASICHRPHCLPLDEIGDLPFEVQAHLLRFLPGRHHRAHQRRQVDHRQRPCHRRDACRLHQAVAAHQLPRGSVLSPACARHHSPRRCASAATIFSCLRISSWSAWRKAGRAKLTLSPEAARFIAAYPWPGNVRELIASLRRAVVMEESAAIQVAALGLHPIQHEPADPAALRRT